MSAGSEAVLYDIFGDPMAVEADTAIPAGTAILINGGSDGTNARYIKVDSSGNQVMIGLGTAGSPAGGVVSIQGVGSGTPVTVSGTVTATNPSVGTNDSAIPSSSTLIGGSDGTNLRSLRIFDLDSGAGQQWVLGVGLRKSAGGGSVEFGTSSDPIRIDPTGTTTQPVSGTVTANQGGSWTVAATQSGTWTVQPGNTANTTPWLATINQGGNSATVTASNALKVDGSAVTQPVSGTVTVTQSTASNLRAQLASESTTGTAVPSTAVMVGGSDGTNLRPIFTDSSGRQIVIGAAANGAAVAGNPVLIAGSDGTNARSIRTLNDGTVQTRYKELATFTACAIGTVVGNNKSMLSIVNTSGSAVTARISAIYVVNVQTSAVTGVTGTFEIRRCVSHSAGTQITAIERMDSNDSLNGSITVRTGATIGTESANLLWRAIFSTDDWGPGTSDVESGDHIFQTMFPVWSRKDYDNKPIILRANEGLTVKFATNSTAGSFDILVVFTQE